MSSIEARLHQLETRAALADLVASYCAAVDDRDLDTLAGLFTPDGEFGHVGEGSVRGREQIRDYYRGRLTDIPYSFHYPHTHTVEVHSTDAASGEVAAHAEMGRVDLPPLRAALRYRDDYRRQDGVWRFASRQIRFLYFAPADEIDAGRMGELRVRWPGSPRPADLPA